MPAIAREIRGKALIAQPISSIMVLRSFYLCSAAQASSLGVAHLDAPNKTRGT
jgi:hypothetical protein